MKKTLFVLATLLMLASTAMAVPAKPGLKRMLTLAGGKQVEAVLVGDEHGHYWQSADGRIFRMSAVKDVFEETDGAAIIMRAQARRAQSNERRSKRLAPQRRAVGEFGNYVGNKKGLIILVNFSDLSFKTANNAALYNRIANEENFKQGSFVGSVHDYFYAQSMGLFNLTFDIAGPYTVSGAQSYYGGNDRDGNDLHPAEMIIEAVKLANDDVNYADYDWDGDGEVDQVYVIYAGNGEADSNVSNSIWPHEWDLESARYYGDGTGSLRLDGVKINTYACGSELSGSNTIEGIGTMCHEFSHCLGYPDFYDTEYNGGRGMDAWDLMDMGSYNGNGHRPAGYTSYERWMAGWKEPIELADQAVEVSGMKSLQEGGDFYIMYNEGHRNEYYLLENRQKDNWDAGTPGKGLLILHVDYNKSYWESNTVNNTKNHQRMTWVAADNSYQSSYGYLTTQGMANDPFPYGSNNSFGNDTKPAATLFNANTDGSKLLNKLVYDITRNSNGTMSFKYKPEGAEEEEPGEVTGDGDYRRVNSTDELTEDATYLIVYEASSTAGAAYAGLNTSKSVHYGDKVDVTIDGYTINTDEACPVQLEKAENGDWYIKDQEDYLYYKGGSTNSLDKTDDPYITGTRWVISSSDILNSDYEVENRKLQYNTMTSGLRFACYKGTQKDVVLYKKAGSGIVKQEAELSFSETEVTTEAENTEFAAPALVNPHDLPVTYASSNETLATVDEQSGEVTIGSSAGTVTITAKFKGNDTFKAGTASYTIIITAKPIVKQDADLSFSETEVTTEAENAEFIAPSLVNPHDLAVTYASSDETLATIDEQSGAVTIGSNAGTVTITATFEGDDYFNEGSASYTIIITEKPIVKQDAGLSFSETEVTTEAENADFIAPTLLNPHDLPVTYASSDETLATVDDLGVVTIGTEPGTVTITATFEGDDYFNEGSASYTIIITEKPIVKQDADLSFSETEVTTEAENAEFIAPSLVNPHDLAVTYASSDETLATVDEQSGAVTIGSNAGTVTITATFEGDDYFNEGSASYTIIITEKPIVKQDADLSFSETEVTTEAENADFIAPTLVNPHDLVVTYASSDETLATVDEQSGTVTIGSNAGTVTITATFEGDDYFNEGSASYTIVITEKIDLGISELQQRMATGTVVYDLQGRRINITALRKGIYIVDGRKVVVK